MPKLPKMTSLQFFLQYIQKEVTDEVDFLHANKHQNFLQVDFNTLGTKNFHKVVLSLLMGMIKHSQSTHILPTMVKWLERRTFILILDWILV